MGTWQGLRKSVRERLHSAIQKRLDVHYTVYKRPGAPAPDNWRFWVTVDGEERYSVDVHHPDAELHRLIPAGATFEGEGPVEISFLMQGLKEWLNLPVDAAIASPNPLVRGLALCDPRMGKRRLREFPITDRTPVNEHALVKLCYELRQQAERGNPSSVE